MWRDEWGGSLQIGTEFEFVKNRPKSLLFEDRLRIVRAMRKQIELLKDIPEEALYTTCIAWDCVENGVIVRDMDGNISCGFILVTLVNSSE